MTPLQNPDISTKKRIQVHFGEKLRKVWWAINQIHGSKNSRRSISFTIMYENKW